MQPGERSSALRRSGWSLVLVMALAIGLRMPTATRGFFHYDEAQFLFAVQPAVLMARKTLRMERWPRLFAEKAPLTSGRVPSAAFTAKPTYDIVMIVWATFLGLTPTSVAVLSLLFGLATIVLLYQIARRAFDDRVAVIAAIILAVSGYHVFFAGSQSVAETSAFFVLLAAGLYLDTLNHPGSKGLVIAGASLGVAYGTHYNLIPYVAVVFGLEGLRLAIGWRQGLQAGVTRLAILGVSFLSVVGLFEIFYRMLIPAAYAGMPNVTGAYLAQLRYQFGFLVWTAPSGADRFSRLLLDSEGVLVCGLAALGWLASVPAKLRDPRTQTLLALPAAHFVASALAGRTSPVFTRMTVAILPFVAIWAACGVTLLGNAFGRVARSTPAIVQVLVVVLIAAIGVPKAYALAHLQSGYAESAAYVLKYGGGKQVTLGLPLEQYYLGSFQGTYGLPISLDALRGQYARDGVRLLVLDHRVHILEEWGNPLGPYIRAIEDRVAPEATFPNPMAATMVVVAENAMSRQSLARSLADPRSGEIRIYDLSKVLTAK